MDNQNAVANIEARLNELKNMSRIVANALSLIADTDIKGGHAQAVLEILTWLNGFNQSITGQIKTLEATLPVEEVKIPEIVA